MEVSCIIYEIGIDIGGGLFNYGNVRVLIGDANYLSIWLYLYNFATNPFRLGLTRVYFELCQLTTINSTHP